VPPLSESEAFRWTPDAAPDGPISMVLSSVDGLIIVYRNGVEIGRARIVVRNPDQGTHAYIVAEGFMDGDNPLLPGTRMPKWITIGIPGHTGDAGKVVDAESAGRIAISHEFAANILPLLKPGVVLLTTDEPVLPESTGGALQVLDSDPPSA
jgi:hypothetical protein